MRQFLFIALLASACTTTWRFERVEGEEATINPHTWDDVNCTALSIKREDAGTPCQRASEPIYSCASDSRLCQTSPRNRSEVVNPGETLDVALGFVHLSDARLREHRLRIVGDPNDVGPRAPAAFELRRNDDAVLLATILAANQLGLRGTSGLSPRPSRPDFAIHTGNAVGAGAFSELAQFVAAMDALEFPWFNVLGNTDVRFLGDRPNESVQGLNVILPYAPIGDGDRFMRFHSQKGHEQDATVFAPARRGADHAPSTFYRKDSTDPMSFHGFDLACRRAANQNALCPEARGYYDFTLPFAEAAGEKRQVRGLVLNTAEAVSAEELYGITRGRMLPEQLRWLAGQLAPKEDSPLTYFIVFGHHPIAEMDTAAQREKLLELLVGNPRVLAYVSGHTTLDAFTAHDRKAGPPLWELTAGSTFVFPQFARHVELLRGPSGKLYLRVAAFRQGLSDSLGLRDAAPFGSGDFCPPSMDGTPYCTWLSRRARQGRNAARSLVDEPEALEARAAQGSNGLLLVYAP